jgi:hypothetical protein
MTISLWPPVSYLGSLWFLRDVFSLLNRGVGPYFVSIDTWESLMASNTCCNCCKELWKKPLSLSLTRCMSLRFISSRSRLYANEITPTNPTNPTNRLRQGPFGYLSLIPPFAGSSRNSILVSMPLSDSSFHFSCEVRQSPFYHMPSFHPIDGWHL